MEAVGGRAENAEGGRMTLPEEMFNSIRSARHFMLALMDPKATPKVPKAIRQRARDRLKHFPSDYEVSDLESMKKASSTDKNILINELNKELNSINNEILLAQRRLNEIAKAIQQLLNKS